MITRNNDINNKFIRFADIFAKTVINSSFKSCILFSMYFFTDSIIKIYTFLVLPDFSLASFLMPLYFDTMSFSIVSALSTILAY